MTTQTGGASNTGGTVSSGGTIKTGGVSSTGGTVGTGGSPRTGGTASTGGTTSAGGISRSGGISTTGGTSNAGGSSSTGGTIGAGGIASGGTIGAGGIASGGTTSAAGTSGTCQPATCGSHKWACWKMPNPTSSGLPNPASYTVANGIVHDNLTCLDWQQVESSTSYTNADAITYCASLSLGGNSDWRVPTRVEVSSVMDWTRSPAIDAAFTGVGGYHETGSNWILTIRQAGAGKTCGAPAADPDAGVPATGGGTCAWTFNMSDGMVSNAYSASNPSRVRCVRGNGTGEAFSDQAVAPPNQYTAISTDEVQDNYTGLIWQRTGDSSGLITWDQAVAYCNSLTIGGNTWRLPSVRELATLVDEAQVAPAINRAMFPNTKYGAHSNNWYWASHAQRNSTTAWWGLNFDDGFTGFNVGATTTAWNYWTAAYAKCVR